MLGIVFTTTDGAFSFLQQHTEGRFEGLEEGSPVQLEDLIVMVTGPGKIKATLATERLLRTGNVDQLLHTGTCTALDDEISVGAVVGVSFVLEGDRVELDAPTYPRMPLDCPNHVEYDGTLVSQDHTPAADDDLNYWARLADIRDSTGYAVAYVAAQHGIPCRIAKGVSMHRGDETESPDAAHDAVTEYLQHLLESDALQPE